MKVGILTDFISHDPAYSLCGVVMNQVKMLANEVDLTVFVRGNWSPEQLEVYAGAKRVVVLDPGETGSNTVEVTDASEAEIVSLLEQFETHFADLDVILTHDMIYQANMWKYHVAYRRFAQRHDKTKWLHWIHSATSLNTINKTKQYRNELQGKPPNSKIVVMNNEEINRKASAFGYERDQVVLIPNPYDIFEHYHPFTRQIIEAVDDTMWHADVVMVYPARLDRGKQVEVLGEIAEGMSGDGWDVRVIVVDFHSTGGDKPVYKEEMKKRFGYLMQFTSDVMHETSYRVPHQVVMDLFDYADVFIHPSKSESDPLIVPEAMWKRNLLVMNFDLPVFRQYDGRALFGKFSSNIDVVSGEAGETNTEYGNRQAYMQGIGRAIAYMIEQDMILKNHRLVRQDRSCEAVKKKYLLPALHG